MDIIIQNLSKSYGEKQVFYNFSASIKEKCITCVMAPSGRGKTTLIRILAGLEKADEGTIQGLENKKISMVFQENRLCENLNSLLNVRLVCNKSVTKEEITAELERIGLKGSETQPVRELSGGMRRRVALVRAILPFYDILILDEPFKGLDEENKKMVMAYTKEKSRGKTVILVTHDQKEAETMGGDILYLE